MANFNVKILTGPSPKSEKSPINLMQHYGSALKSRLQNQNGSKIGALAQAIMQSQTQRMIMMSQ